MGDQSNPLTSQFEIYVSQFDTMSKTILAGASAQFRDTSNLTTSLTALKGIFQEADAALAKYGLENTPLSANDELQLNMLGAKLKAQIQAVVGLFPAIEAADLKYIQSAKVPTLDQSKLKGLEEKLKAADAVFAANLTSMIPPGPGQQPPMPKGGADFPATFAGNLTNVPEPNQGSGL